MVYTFYFYPKKKKRKRKEGQVNKLKRKVHKEKDSKKRELQCECVKKLRSKTDKIISQLKSQPVATLRSALTLKPIHCTGLSLSLSLSNMLLCFDQTQLLSLLELGNTPRKKKKRELGITAFIFLLSIPIYISFFISLKKTNT